MKLWFQSGGTYRYEKENGDYFLEEGKHLEVQCAQAARPGTEVYVTGLPRFVKGFSSYRFTEYYATAQVFNNMFKAQKEGYDAFIIGCPVDQGLTEGREMLDIPVVGIFQSVIYAAAMLSNKFAIICQSPHLKERYSQKVASYGLSEKFAGAYWYKTQSEETYGSYGKSQSVLERFITTAREAIDNGASAIVPFSNGTQTLCYESGLTKSGIDGVPVLDAVSIAVKTAESLVDLNSLGVKASRKLCVYGHPSEEMLEKTLRTYADSFHIEHDCLK